jgi:hypothetical protein
LCQNFCTFCASLWHLLHYEIWPIAFMRISAPLKRRSRTTGRAHH